MKDPKASYARKNQGEQQTATAGPFIPSRDWQDVPDWAAVPPGGQYRVNMATGKSQARWAKPPSPETVVDKRRLPKKPRSGAGHPHEKPQSTKLLFNERRFSLVDPKEPDKEPTAPEQSQEDLAQEAKARFKRYIQDRSVFPAPMRNEAYYGIAGTVVRLMALHCESSLESLLVQFLVAAGNLIGRSVYVYAGGPWLFTNEFTICVGATARGRKGTAWRMNEDLFELIAPEWIRDCTDNDVQTGEGIVQKIRDEIRGFEKYDRRKKTSDQPPAEVVLDPGVTDKRLQIVEEEFSHVLKMARRQGNTLTESYRKGWDSPRTLRTSNKNSRLVATDPHLSLIGHTNRDELLATLTDIELSNGFANRILWCASQRRELMPDAQYLDWNESPELVERLKAIFRQYFPNTCDPRRFRRSYAANELWKQLYQKLNDQNHVSFIDGVLVRDTSHLLKLALIYAVLDQASQIEEAHLQAALAVCDYSQASARWLFSERTGNRLANTIFWALVRTPEGMSRAQILDEVCYRNTPKVQLDLALEALAKNDMVRMEISTAEKGRKIEIWFTKFPAALGEIR